MDEHTYAAEMTADEAIQMVLRRPEMYGLMRKPEVTQHSKVIAEAREATTCRCVEAPEQECGTHGDATAKLIGALADALFDALATRVPVQGEPSNRENCPGSGGHAGVGTYCMVCDLLTVEPNDDREALAIAAMEAQYKFYPSMPNHSWTDISENDRKGYRAVADAMRATVPDTTTERYEKAEHDRLYWRRRYQSMHKRAKAAEAERDAALVAIERVRAARNAEYDYTLRSALYRILVDYDAAGFSRAAVPDADAGFLEAVCKIEGEKFDLRLERDAALAAIERVRVAVEKHKHWNEGCGWDVPTIEVLAALDGAPEPVPTEWVYRARNSILNSGPHVSEATARATLQLMIDDYVFEVEPEPVLIERRPRFSWLPVEGEKP